MTTNPNLATVARRLRSERLAGARAHGETR